MKRKYDTAEVQAAREQYVPVFEYIEQNGGRTVQDYSRLRHCTAWVGTQVSAQVECTCVNCGRTVINGGCYADGRTRCPIEEHYALPKDGYCYLWEKRNVTVGDYPEGRTDD